MKSLAKKTGTKLAPRRNPTIYELFRNNKDSVENKDKSGIYIIPMMNLNINVKEEYIGMTMRSLEERLQEHRNDI